MLNSEGCRRTFRVEEKDVEFRRPSLVLWLNNQSQFCKKDLMLTLSHTYLLHKDRTAGAPAVDVNVEAKACGEVMGNRRTA